MAERKFNDVESQNSKLKKDIFDIKVERDKLQEEQHNINRRRNLEESQPITTFRKSKKYIL